MLSKTFLYDLAERVIKTAAAALLGLVALKLGVDPAGSDTGSVVANTTAATALLNLLTGRVGSKDTGSVLFDILDDPELPTGAASADAS